VVARLLGIPATTAVAGHEDADYIAVPDEGFRPWPTSPREQCCHVD
jgi:hypothetical protein